MHRAAIAGESFRALPSMPALCFAAIFLGPHALPSAMQVDEFTHASAAGRWRCALSPPRPRRRFPGGVYIRRRSRYHGHIRLPHDLCPSFPRQEK
ncbi:hypothetical protein KL86DES1_21001 [uncultured Desulfovibrio sp.]|uniref:Uncharacterized protein n=1 Tax=uncultured Desulfovibrio sp. TaxID=167968 RepID=A0A212L649_9BACT|nr:hypothetical protein KL86DES1_21001 [uncultured Desulfovibrio sp.]VZH33902.1 conserved protein of unknown function [Desulfovibrio sp. 86]